VEQKKGSFGFTQIYISGFLFLDPNCASHSNQFLKKETKGVKQELGVITRAKMFLKLELLNCKAHSTTSAVKYFNSAGI
jgi:hypothetical protein